MAPEEGKEPLGTRGGRKRKVASTAPPSKHWPLRATVTGSSAPAVSREGDAHTSVLGLRSVASTLAPVACRPKVQQGFTPAGSWGAKAGHVQGYWAAG
eukprot:scaffold62150_cov60-Phaeocystis_antarctica.AAC.2